MLQITAIIIAMQILPLEKKDYAQAAGILSQAFFEYPDIAYYFPDLNKREKQLNWLFNIILLQTEHCGNAWSSTDGMGVMTLQFTHIIKPKLWDLMKTGIWRAPFIMNWKSLRRLLYCESYTSKVRQLFMNSQPYLYLAYLGISPKAQGKGLGKAFVRHAQLVALERKEVLYLETHHQKNVDLYQRLGFRLIAENPIPGHSISFFNMVWEEVQTNS